VGANAIVGTTVNYIFHGSGKGMVLVTVNGTAVVVEDLPTLSVVNTEGVNT
jgi:uncharacterized protein YbjQ (UPF0145 family)